MPNLYRNIDWNRRNFGRSENLALVWVGAGLAVGVITAGFWIASGSPGWSYPMWVGLYIASRAFNVFVIANRKRRGLYTPPQYYGPSPGRPISIGTMQAILGGGVLLFAALLGLLIWVAR